MHLPDPLRPSHLVDRLARALAPRFRVLSVPPRAECAYQVYADDLAGVLGQFGFEHVVLVAEGLSCGVALLVAAWYPPRVAALVLIDARTEAPQDAALLARSFRECPPDWPRLRDELDCPIADLAGDCPGLATEVERLLTRRLP